MNQTAKAARKRRLQEIYERANAAERAHDSFRFHQAIRELAPKQPFTRILLRSDTGDLLGPTDSADALQTWYQQLYDAPDTVTTTTAFEWPFTEQDLANSLNAIPAFKALDPKFAPAPIWKQASTTIAEFLHPHFVQCAAQGTLPKCWSRGTLALLNKPGKRGHHASELRPIALLEPSGKCILGILARDLLQAVAHRLFCLPLFAYLPNRGGEDALRRVATHCRTVRHMISENQHQIHLAALHTAQPALAGGLLVSLDLSKAFDVVDRDKLFTALHSPGGPDIPDLTVGTHLQ